MSDNDDAAYVPPSARGSSSSKIKAGPSPKRSLAMPLRPAKRPRTTAKSVWNAPDDWDEMLATASLSTASVSVRRARLRGLPSLVECAESAAVRSFKKLYTAGKERDAYGKEGKGWWETEWEWVPDHAKIRLVRALVGRHGDFITKEMYRRLCIVPPYYELSGALLPVFEGKGSTSPPLPHPAIAKQIRFLKVQHCMHFTDATLAQMVRLMPNLESVNLKGCALVGPKTIQAIQSLKGLRSLNLKGTGVTAEMVEPVIAAHGEGLVRLKLPEIYWSNPRAALSPLHTDKDTDEPRDSLLTHLCLQGDWNRPRKTPKSSNAVLIANTALYPARELTHPDILGLEDMRSMFRSLTHLYLPGIALPADTILPLAPNTLVKFSTIGAQPTGITAITLTALLEGQAGSLKGLHLSDVVARRRSYTPGPTAVDSLAEALVGCGSLEKFSWIVPGRSNCAPDWWSLTSQATEVLWTAAQSTWRDCLRILHIDISSPIYCQLLPSLKHLDILTLPNTALTSDHDRYAYLHGVESDTRADLAALRSRITVQGYDVIAQLPALRSLDLTGASVTSEEVQTIVRGCPLLSRIDLTACRGVQVRQRRGAFEAYEEAEKEKLRAEAAEKKSKQSSQLRRGTRRR